MSRPPIRICFVCLGNICRSPTAEGVMKKIIEEASLDGRIEVESAGTAAYHAGERPDPRSREAASRRGISTDSRARQFVASDFARFDFVLAMDTENLVNLRKLSSGEHESVGLGLLRSYDPLAIPGAEVPDPYYGGERGFEEVIDLCEAACRGLLRHIRDRADFD